MGDYGIWEQCGNSVTMLLIENINAMANNINVVCHGIKIHKSPLAR